MATDIYRHVDDRRNFGQAVCRRIVDVIAKLGFSEPVEIDLPRFEAAEFTLVTDPFTQSQDLVGYWYNTGRQRIGQIRFHGDGSCYAEYDVVQPHPAKKRFFVEAINAWGKEDDIRAEAKLLEIPQ